MGLMEGKAVLVTGAGRGVGRDDLARVFGHTSVDLLDAITASHASTSATRAGI